MFIEIPASLLKSIASGKERIPKLYYHPVPMVRNVFWLRLRLLYKYVQKYISNKDKCIDFGCGSGVLLPSLASSFNEVIGLDIELEEARKVMEQYQLKNVSLKNADINTVQLAAGGFDAIFAADVLEHFKDLAIPVQKIRTWLNQEGYLMTSLPTENIFTRITRSISCTAKPFDHYHSAKEVERYLCEHGFIKIETSLVLTIMPLYRVTIWKKKKDE